MISRLSALSSLLVGFGCSPKESGDRWLLVLASPEHAIQLAELRVTPAEAVLERHVELGHVALRVARSRTSLVLHAPGACPATVEVGLAAPNHVVEQRLVPLFELGPASRVVGLGRSFSLRAEPNCPEAEAVAVNLLVTGGAPLASGKSSDRGRAFDGRTQGADTLTGRPAFGIVPVSARGSGVTELTAVQTLPGGRVLERPLTVQALTRASGLPNVAEGHAVLLSGSGLRLAARPEGSHAELRIDNDLAELTPDQSGAYSVRSADGRELLLQAGRYDETPLDCGRGDCHAAVSAGAEGSPMQRVLADDLGGAHPLAEPGCALACHATGEPGVTDGGFTDVLAELGHGQRLPERYAELPRALRRLGGVGCLACHGPGSIPEPSARWAVLRSDVCAVCHDAPPRYGHVAALATSRMAAADRDPRTRSDARCARCHTTYGALGRPERRPPSDSIPTGIACAACHEVHPHARPAPGAAATSPRTPAFALLRAVPLDPLFAELGGAVNGPSRVCLGCHAPDGASVWASAAAIWAGRGGVDPETGAPLEAPAPHTRDSRGCLGCHESGPDSLVLGRGHAFHTARTICQTCHAGAPPRRDLMGRARTLEQALAPSSARTRSPGDPPHVELGPPVPLTPARERALRDVRLVLEDPAADVHHPSYAILLLDRAEAVLGTSRGPTRPGSAP